MNLRAPFHELGEALEFFGGLGGLVAVDEAGDDFRRSGLQLARIDGAGGAVNGEVVAFLIGLAADGDGLGVVINIQRRCAADADLAHLTGH